MKQIAKWTAAFAFAAIAFAVPVRSAAQVGSVEFVIQMTPSDGMQEPVRGFPVFLLSESYEQIAKEADAAFPKQDQSAFIDSLDVSKELKAWMKKNQWIMLSGQEFIKKVTPDDVMNIPEFYKAYMARNAGDQSADFPIPKFRESEKQKDPAKFQKDEDAYKAAVRHYVEQIPESINGIDLELQDVDPSRKWRDGEAKRDPQVRRRITELAEGKYMVARTETNLQGQGFFPNVSPGTYYLSSLDVSATVGDARSRWDFPLTVQAGQVAYAALSDVNAVPDAAHVSP